MRDGTTSPLSYGFTALAALLLFAGAGCDDDLTTYYPMDEGRTWNYRVSVSQDGESVSANAVVANLATADVLGRTGVPQRSELFGQTVVRYLTERSDGIVEYAQQSGDTAPVAKDRPDYVLKIPIVPGTSWSSSWQSTTGGTPVDFPTVKAISTIRETVIVPAGTFADCLRIRIAGKNELGLPKGQTIIEVRGEEWYAPGVGFIKGTFRETVNHGEATTELAINLESFGQAR